MPYLTFFSLLFLLFLRCYDSFTSLDVGLTHASRAAQNQPIAGIDPRVSALYGTMAGLPPVYMLATEAEVFADDTRRFCAKLREAQVPHVEDVSGGPPSPKNLAQ